MAYDHKVAFRQDGQGVGSPFQVTKLNLEHARSQDLDNNTHLPPLKRLLGHIANQRNHVQQVRYACGTSLCCAGACVRSRATLHGA